MKSFILGKVISPDIVSTTSGDVAKFGVLVGRTSQEFSVFKNTKDFNTGEIKSNPLFAKCENLVDGDKVIILVATSVTKNNTLAMYLNNISIVSDNQFDDFSELI